MDGQDPSGGEYNASEVSAPTDNMLVDFLTDHCSGHFQSSFNIDYEEFDDLSDGGSIHV